MTRIKTTLGMGTLVLAALAPSHAMAASQSDLLVRSTVIAVFANASSSGPLKLSTGDQASVAIDGTYFFRPNVAVNALATFITPNVKSNGSSLGSVGLVPPTFTLQYHFAPDGGLRPYAGAGFNYNFFGNVTGSLSSLRVEVKDTIGFVAQVGADYMLTKTVSLNTDLKYLRFNADVNVGANRALNDKLNFKGVILGVGLGFWL